MHQASGISHLRLVFTVPAVRQPYLEVIYAFWKS